MLRISSVARVRAVAARADLRLVGIGQMDQSAQVHVDGFVTREELFEMRRLGAAGELTGWAFDAEGPHHRRRHQPPPHQHFRRGSPPPRPLAAAIGEAKVPAIRAALKGRLINGLITDETTAGAILKE